MPEFPETLTKLMDRQDMLGDEAACALDAIMQGRIPAAQVAAFLTALRIKGETSAEIAALAKTMRKNAVKVRASTRFLVDTAGTGGDNKKTFNISTCAAFVAAGAGARVAKHGNRAVSSKSGSADVLEQLGVKINADSSTARRQLEKTGITFLFAPVFHPAMKAVAQVRKELGFRTVFNILGPLVNPAGAKRQLIGVYDKALLEKMAGALKLLGTERALLVSSDIDEISISADTDVCEIAGSKMKNYTLAPEDFGLARGSIRALQVGDKSQSADMILGVLNGKAGPARDVVLLNAGAAVYVSGLAPSIKQGIRLAQKAVDSGKALEKLEMLREFNGHP